MAGTYMTDHVENRFELLLEASKNFTQTMGLHDGLIIEIFRAKTDWEFIIKIDAMLEAAAKAERVYDIPRLVEGAVKLKAEGSRTKRSNGADAAAEADAALLDEVHSFLCRFVSYPSEHAAIAHTLWVALHDDASKRLTGLLGKDPLDLVAKIDDALKQQDITDPEERARKVMRAFGRQTTQRLTTEELNNYQQILAERGRLQGGLGIGSSFDLVNNKSVSANMEALSNSWNNFLTALAGPNSENFIKLLQTLTSAVQSMTSAVNAAGPDSIASIGKGLAVLGVALTGAGAAAMIAALGAGGWIVLGLSAVVAAAAKWGPDVLKGVYSGLESLADAANRFVAWMASIIDKIKGLFSGGGESPGQSTNSAGPCFTRTASTLPRAAVYPARSRYR
jgi:hypothetical protein